MTAPQWFVVEVNPYPWKVPPISVGRKGGKIYPVVGRDEGLHTYKMAVAAQVATMDPKMIDGEVALFLWFWRNVPSYTTHQGRTARKHEADNTNVQKATEDALQGLVYANDKDVKYNASEMVAQGPDVTGLLVICATSYTRGVMPFPDRVQFAIDEVFNRYPEVEAKTFDSDEEVPF